MALQQRTPKDVWKGLHWFNLYVPVVPTGRSKPSYLMLDNFAFVVRLVHHKAILTNIIILSEKY